MKHTPAPWTLTTFPTNNGQGFCHKIGPFPTTSLIHKETHACVYLDNCKIGIDETNPVSAELTANAHLIAAAPDLLAALESALRYIEVTTAYTGAMTADQVELAIKNESFPCRVEIGANSTNTLAKFDISATRAAIAKAKGENHG